MNKDWDKISEQVDKALEDIEKTSGATEVTPTPPEKDGRFGTDLHRAAQAGAAVVRKVPAAFTTLGFSGDNLLENAANAQGLRNVAKTLRQSAETHEHKAAYYESLVASQTGKILDVTKANDINPAPQPHSHALRKAAEPLRSIMDERSTTVSTNRQRGKSNRSEQETAQEQIRDLRLANKYLSGEQLKPADITGAPPADEPYGRRPGRPRPR